MFVDQDILITWGAIAKKYKKGEFIFHESEMPQYFHQIISGRVKMYNTNEDGKEFTQAEFTAGESFGEPPLFIEQAYPATAIASEDTVILKIKKMRFLELMDEYPLLQKKIIQLFAKRIYSKAITVREIVNSSPESRIIAFLISFKKKNNKDHEEIEIPYTRQEIANFVGLRVETVIRTLHKMQEKQTVKILHRKLYF